MPNDFNGDGRDDILWINYETDQLSNWLGTETGAFIVNDANALMSVPGAGFWSHTGSADSGIHPVAIGDFDGDGRSDLVLRDFNLLSMVLATPSGGFQANAAYSFPVVSPEWFIVGTGDFNGDGRDDLLWHHLFGAVDTWLSTPGGGFVEQGLDAAYAPEWQWQVAGTGDFDGDGLDDILWRNIYGGSLSNWLAAEGGGFIINDANAFAQVPIDWYVEGTGDFNGDGRDDILWRNVYSGSISNWLGTDTGGWIINDTNALSNVPVEWRVAGIGDFNGDGFDDIFWRHVDGTVSDWLGQANGGFVVNDANALGHVPLGWWTQDMPLSLWDNTLLGVWL